MSSIRQLLLVAFLVILCAGCGATLTSLDADCAHRIEGLSAEVQCQATAGVEVRYRFEVPGYGVPIEVVVPASCSCIGSVRIEVPEVVKPLPAPSAEPIIER